MTPLEQKIAARQGMQVVPAHPFDDTGDPMYDDFDHPPVPEYTPGDAAEPPTTTAVARQTAAPAKPPRFGFLSSAKLDGTDFTPSWLIPHVIVRNQPGIIAGPSKVLKTGLAIDAAVSLAAGCPFLGEFPIPTRARVAVVSGESGGFTLKETANRICKARGVNLANLGENLQWCFDLPVLSDLTVMTEFADAVAGIGAEVVFIDPLYLCLGPVDAKNMFEMGAALRVVAEVLLRAGSTPILLHHANRQLTVGEPMELTHLAYSGLEQFARQFLLINRREAYKSDGAHDLWLRVGGSAGHGGLWAVHVNEGVVNEDFGGRTWDVSVQTAGEVKADRVTDREDEKREQARRRMQAEDAQVLSAIDAEKLADAPAATLSRIKTRNPNLSGAKLKDIIERLIEDDVIEPVAFKQTVGKGAKRDVTGYIRIIRINGIPNDLSLFPGDTRDQ